MFPYIYDVTVLAQTKKYGMHTTATDLIHDTVGVLITLRSVVNNPQSVK